MFAFSACETTWCFVFVPGAVGERSGRGSAGRARLHGLAPGGRTRALAEPAEPAARRGGETAACSPHGSPPTELPLA